MFTPAVATALNEQITAEFNSAHLYLAMAIHCANQGFMGFAHWLRIQQQEELEHAHKLIDYVLLRGGKVCLASIAAPACEFGSMQAVFQQVLEHEQQISASVHRLYELSLNEKDRATTVFLQWYIQEQVEEEATVTDVLTKLKIVGEKPSSVLYLDKQCGKRGQTS